MTVQPYDNYCGIARACEILGSRWSMLLVRDLFLGPKRGAELSAALPGITRAALNARLGELEAAGLVRRGRDSGEDTFFELTDYGRDLEPILLQLGRWGARSLGDLRDGEVVTIDMAVLALRSLFRPEHALGVRRSFEVWFGPLVVNARVEDGTLTVEAGELPGADLVVTSPVLKHLMAAQLTPSDALWLGIADVTGDPHLFDTFVELFHIPPAPERPNDRIMIG